MAKTRTPTNILELKGAFKKDPQRGEARANEPVPTGGIGEPPSHLSDEEQAIWHEVADIVAPGVLANCDRIIMEMVVKSISQFRNGEISQTGFNRLHIMLGSLGMTPADRSKVSVPAKDNKNPYDDL